MKIATYNVNNVRKRLPNLLAWLAESRPDVVCLQELKTLDKDFPADALSAAGYDALWRGEKSWNGVAILSRIGKPILTRRELPGDADDLSARYIEAAVGGVLIGCLYAPNGNPQPGPKFDAKLAWLARLQTHAMTLRSAGIPVVLAGDYNIVPTDADIYATRSWSKDALLHPLARGAFADLIGQGWTDALRALFPDQVPYTFWSYFRERWPRDAGLRIDHFLLSPACAGQLQAGGVDRDVRGAEGASDHAPVWIDLREPPKPQARGKRAR